MIEDILYSEQFLVFEVPESTAAGYDNPSQVKGFSYDGDNFMFTESSASEITSIFIF